MLTGFKKWWGILPTVSEQGPPASSKEGDVHSMGATHTQSSHWDQRREVHPLQQMGTAPHVLSPPSPYWHQMRQNTVLRDASKKNTSTCMLWYVIYDTFYVLFSSVLRKQKKKDRNSYHIIFLIIFFLVKIKSAFNNRNKMCSFA